MSTTEFVHECVPMGNPRHKHTCRKCGKLIPDAPTEPRRRNLEFERDVTLEAAKGVLDPSALVEHAEARARTLSGEYVNDPMYVAPGRDRLRDVREELADGRNHLVWWLEENPDHEKTDDALIALRFVLLAYDRLLESVE